MKRKPEDIKIVKKIKAPFEIYSTMRNMEDFYEMVGLLDLKGDCVGDVTKIHMNEEECEALKDLMFKNNYRKGKLRSYKKEYLRSCVAMEWVCYSPCSSVIDVPKGEIWLEEGWTIRRYE